MILTAFSAGPRRLAVPAESPRFVAQEIDPHVGNVCYAVTVADVNGDGKPDVVAVTEDAVFWYENPSWKRHDIIRGGPRRTTSASSRTTSTATAGSTSPSGPAGARPTRRKPARSSGWAATTRELADPPDRLRRADAAPPALGRREGNRQEATRRRTVAGPRHQGAELGRRAGRSACSSTTFPTTRPSSPGRSRSPTVAAHDPQPPAHRSQWRPPRRDRAGLLGGRLRARPW